MGNTKKLPEVKMTNKLIKDINGYLSKDSGNKTVACQILMLENYKNKIVVDWWKEKIPKLFFVIAYEAIRTLAIYGCPRRSTSGRVGGNGPRMLSQSLIEAIDRELRYQSTLQGSGRADAVEHGIEGQIVTLIEYQTEVVHRWTREAGDEPALDSIRKVAAIACRAIICYGDYK